MIAKKQRKNAAYTKSRAQDVSDLCRYICNARSHVADRPTSTAEPEKVLCSGSLGLNFKNPDAQISEMSALASHAKSGNPIDHWVLSWQAHENPTPDQLHAAAKMFVHELGLDGHQVIYGAHQNTQNTHLHLAINRVSPETGRVVKVNKGFDHLAAARAICVIEHTQGWNQEPNPVYRMTPQGPQERTDRKRSLSDTARAAELTTAIESLERRARALAPVIAQATSWQDLHARLAAVGVTYEKRKGGAVLKFGSKGFVKASKAAREASLRALEKRFNAPFERPEKLAPKPYEPATPRLRRDLDPISLILALIFHLLGLHRAARQILYTKQELERAALRQTKFASAQAKWAAQSVLREEHTEQRKELKTLQAAEISEIKKMTPEEAIAFCNKNNLFPAETQAHAVQAGEDLQNKEDIMANEFENFEMVHSALGADRYRITAKDENTPAGEGPKHFTYGKWTSGPDTRTETGAFRGWLPWEVKEHLPEVIAVVERGRHGTYITPLSKKTHYILIDDINSPEKLALAGKYSAALVCESSPGNRQAILKIHANVDSKIARAAASATAMRINQECGDPAVRSGEQAWRMPGFVNNKPKHRTAEGAPEVKILEAQGGYCARAQSIYNEEIARLKEVQQPQVQAQAAPALAGAVPTSESNRLGIVWADLYGLHGDHIASKISGLSGRNLDYAVACRLRAMGYTDGETVRIIAHSREWNEAVRHGDTPPQAWAQEIARAQSVVNAAYYTPAGDRDAGRLGVNAVKAAQRREREHAKLIQAQAAKKAAQAPQEAPQAQQQEKAQSQEQKQTTRRRRGRSR